MNPDPVSGAVPREPGPREESPAFGLPGLIVPGSNPVFLLAYGVRYLADLILTFYLALSSGIWEGGRGRILSRRVVLQQVYFTAVQALPLVLLIAIGLGALAMIQASVQLPRFGMRRVEGITGLVLFRELAAITVALLVIARSANAMVVEIGNMRINGEIRALEILGINIDRLVVLPRITAMALSLPLLTAVFLAGALWGGFALGRVTDLIATDFTLTRLSATLDMALFQTVILRALFFGFVIGTVACRHGLSVQVSATEVPQQATRGVISALTICFLGNMVFSILAL
jgi:phospholipid/cholesterol/gamma-HCH transport system permease protein